MSMRQLAGFILCLAVLLSCSRNKELSREEKSAVAHYKLGISFLNDSMLQLAFVEFQKSIEKNDKDSQVYYAIGHVYYIWEMNNKADEYFTKALLYDRDFSEAHNYLGKVHARLGKLDMAIKEYRLAISNEQYLTPHLPFYNIGMVHMEKGDYGAAEESFTSLIKRFPRFILSYVRLGELYLKKNRLDEAESVLKRGIGFRPDFPYTYVILARVYLKNGKTEQAVSELKHVVEKYPNSQASKEARILLQKDE